MRSSQAWFSKLVVGAFLILFVAGSAPAVRADEVTDWNQTMLRAGLLGATSPIAMTRNAAIVQAAIFDAVNGFERRYEYILMIPRDAKPGAGASRRAAIAQAAYETLVVLYPAQKATLDARLAAAKAAIGMQDSLASITNGATWGKTVALKVLEIKATDHFAPPPEIPQIFGSNIDGIWRSTVAGAGSQFPYMTPWVLLSQNQFRSPAPPLIGSALYAVELQETRVKGRNTSLTRTADETISAWFWNSATASYLWNKAALSLMDGNDDGEHNGEGRGGDRRSSRSLVENARLLASLDLAMADAAIGCWEAKYFYMKWRPITAIQQTDALWLPLFVTPNHPEYPSGHSCLSGAAAAVLADEFGERTRFTVESDLMLGVTRSFRSFAGALQDVINARVYAGIHFRSACIAGQQLGASVAQYVIDNAMQPRHSH